jgi:hypothetical protein
VSKVNYPITEGMYFEPLLVECLPGESGCSPEQTLHGSARTPDSASEATHEAEECLQGVGCSRLPAWWDANDPEVKEDSQVVTGPGGVSLGGEEVVDPLKKVVPSFGTHEKYVQYDERLESLGLQPEPVALPEIYVDPRFGPEEVTQVNPKPGTELAPESVVKVRYNPATAPEAEPGAESGEPSGGFSPPRIPGIQNPFSGLHPCGVFPFGLFCWLEEGIAQFGVGPKCPSATVPLKVGEGPSAQEDGIEMGFCSVPEIDRWVGYWRDLVVFFFTIGCGWTFAKATGAIGAGGGD